MTRVLLKDKFYNKTLVKTLANELSHHVSVDKEKFVNELINQFPNLGLLERNAACVSSMHKILPKEFEQTIDIIISISPKITSFANIMFPEYVSTYGLDSTLSLGALKRLTQYSSSEFAIRHFLRKDFEGTLKTMITWADDENEHIRRLASEGCRHRLPWSFKLPNIEENPYLTLPILEKLKADKSVYVRKSVANHLNDSSRTKPKFIIETLSRWNLNDKNTKWIANRAMRNLIKKGDKEALSLKGYNAKPAITISKIRFSNTIINIGEFLEINVEITSILENEQALLIDYIVHYQKHNGSIKPKVFKLKEVKLSGFKKIKISKKHSFKEMTTRIHYPGKHFVEIIVNGLSFGHQEFNLKK